MSHMRTLEKYVICMERHEDRNQGVGDPQPHSDYTITLTSSLPSSWDVFVQTLHANLEKLSDNMKHNKVTQDIKGKILAELSDDMKHDKVTQDINGKILVEGQQRENNTSEEQVLAV
ncbi:hypothetical protein FRC10_004704 [Ceratobasidium sp. 414]|nr:hypothetical protein FRC10_004704 [Ceratobasidium sp. 414]